jgi:ABC-2 type transport system ATP-binding protein
VSADREEGATGAGEADPSAPAGAHADGGVPGGIDHARASVARVAAQEDARATRFDEAPPLLFAARARIAVDDAVAIDELDVVTRGDRVLFVGDVTVLFAALSGVPLLAASPPATAEVTHLAGEARVVGGEVHLHGLDVASQAHLAVTGFAPLDPPVPRTMPSLEYVAWAARLAGARPRAAREMAAAAMRRLGLENAAFRPAAVLGIAERRALQLAKAIVHDPPALIAEAPLDRLEGTEAAFVTGALAAATEGRRALLSARRLDPATIEGTIARTASHLVFLGERGVVAEGTPAELLGGARIYRLTVTDNAAALRLSLATRGLTLERGPLHFTVALPDGVTAATIVEAASEARAPVVELSPLLG